MNIFLIGFMGSGKTRLGQQLSAKLNRPFIDLDEQIEAHEGRSVLNIFKEKGELYFRDLELKMLQRQIAKKNAVVSLGGGACCNNEAWTFMAIHGLTIYLEVEEKILFGRLRQDRTTRPLIAGLNDEKLRTFIHARMEEREVWYKKSDLIFEKDRTSISFLVQQLNNYLEGK
jgi:shikimate kinase